MSLNSAVKEHATLYEVSARVRAGIILCLGIVTLAAVTVMYGWFAKSTALVQINPAFAPMQFNTALCFLLGALALLARWRQLAGPATVAALACAVLAAASGLQYLLGVDFGIDELAVKAFTTTETSHPGRMSPNTAFCFVLLGSGVLLWNWLHRSRLALLITALSAVVFALGFISFLGYLTGLISTFSWDRYTRMAVHTSVLFILLAAAQLALLHAAARAGGQLQHWFRVIELVAALALLLYVLVITETHRNQQVENALALHELHLKTLQKDIMREVETAQSRMADRWRLGEGENENLWRRDARGYRRDLPHYLGMSWIDREGIERWQEGAAIDALFGDELQEIVAHGSAPLDPVYLFASDRILLLTPVQKGLEFDGWIGGMLSLESLLQPLLVHAQSYSYQLSIEWQVPGDPIVNRLDSLQIQDFNPGTSLHRDVTRLAGLDFSLLLTSTPDFGERYQSPYGRVMMVLIVACLLLLLGMRRKSEIAKAHQQESENLYQRLSSSLNAMIDAVVVIDDKGSIQQVNQSMQDMFGYSEEELLGQNIKLIVPEPDRSRHDGYLQKARLTNVHRILGQRRALMGQKKSGEVFPLLLQVTANNGQHGEVLYTGVMHDLSEQSSADSLLAEKEAMLRAAIKTSTTGFIVLDFQGRILDLNPVVSDFLERTRSDLLGMTITQLTIADEHSSMESLWQPLLTLKTQSIKRDCRFLRADGQPLWGKLSASVVTNPSGELICILAQIVDIDQEMRLQEQLEQRNQALEHSNQELDQFAYVASHDLKSPLNAIQKLAGWIEEDCGDILPDNSVEHFNLLKGRIRRMNKLLDDLLMYSRIGRVSYQTDSLNLAEMVTDIAKLLGRDEFTITAPDFVIRVPRVPFELVLRNLISNAIKHHDRDSGNISVSCDTAPGRYLFRVEDDGPGIPPELQLKAMEMFQTLQSRDEVEGSGMGLALCVKTVKHYGGSLTIESDGHSGTTIAFHWPRPLDADISLNDDKATRDESPNPDGA